MTTNSLVSSMVAEHGYILYGATPKIVAHVASLVAGREGETIPGQETAMATTRGEAIAEAKRLAAGPSREDKSGSGFGADNWQRALWLARHAARGLVEIDPVIAALRRMDD